MRWLKGLFFAIVAIIVLLVGILFVIRNQNTIPLDLIWFKLPSASLALWLLASLIIGVIVGMIAMTGLYIRLRARISRARKEIKRQQSELDRLRTQGLQETN